MSCSSDSQLSLQDVYERYMMKTKYEKKDAAYGNRDVQLVQALNIIGIPKPVNATFFNKDENIIRIPEITSQQEIKKNKRKSYKKSPKRTIQKIIKMNKTKRKQYLMQRLSETTSQSTVEMNEEKVIDENSSQRKDEPSTEPQLKKRNRKWNSKLPKYPKPFHTIKKDDYKHRRYRRDDEIDTRYLLTDFDETEFLSMQNGQDVIRAHVKKYW